MFFVVTDPGVGGTFLTWTLHYLAGHKEYFLREKNCWTAIPSNPLTKINAHKFIPNQPNRQHECSAEQFQQVVKNLEDTPTNTFHTLYFHQFANKHTTEAALEYINTQLNKAIVVDSSDHTLYHCSVRRRAGILIGPGKSIIDHKSIQDYYINQYFADSKIVWDNLQLTDVWDLREFLALNFKPFLVDHIRDSVNMHSDCFIIKGADLWTSFEFTVNDLFDWIKHSIDTDRYKNWKQVYFEWKKHHYQKFMFSSYFNTIIDSILNNYSLDLLRFDLDIEQEAAIQHALIYNHNLNLKTWQLEKFVNTKQLHNLLEPNLHPLSS